MGRVMADCRRFPSESNCSLTIIGEEEARATGAAAHLTEAMTAAAARP